MFKLYLSDPRFPSIEVFSNGSHVFQVIKRSKHYVDDFSRFETPGSKFVSVTFAEDSIREFFEYLSIHPWLYKHYMNKWT